VDRSAASTLLIPLLQAQLLSILLVVVDYLYDFGLFLLPGFALAAFAPVHKSLKGAAQSLIFIISAGATLGYISFWIFFANRPAGRIFTVIVYCLSVSLLFAIWRTGSSSLIVATVRNVRIPLTYATLAGCFYLCLFFLFTDPIYSGAQLAGQRFFHELRPGDNLIPQIFADKLLLAQPLKPFCCGDWLSSDRPPLQSGIFLLERPLHIVHNEALDYEILSVSLQSLWICAVGCLLSSLGTPALRIRQTWGFLIFSGFLFYNSVYTWPKLLAAAFVLFILSILLDSIRSKQPLTQTSFFLSASCLGLALMSHPGSIFSLAIFLVFLIRERNLLSFRGLVLAAVVLALFTVPWTACQKFVDPPGNRLFKMHIAGVIPVDARSAWQALSDAYSTNTLKQIGSNKLSNILLLAGRHPLDTFGVTVLFNDAAKEQSRIAQREWIWNAVGLMNFGWLAWVIVVLRRKRGTLPIPYSGWLIAASLANLVLWSLVMFGADATVTTHSSYADILLLMVGLTGFMLTFPAILRYTLIGLQIFNLCVVWVWSYPSMTAPETGDGVLQWPTLLIGGSLMTILFWKLNLPNDPNDKSTSLGQTAASRS
jgi:hypothetical protein